MSLVAIAWHVSRPFSLAAQRGDASLGLQRLAGTPGVLRVQSVRKATIARADKLHQWAFFLLRAQEYNAEQLRKLLPGLEFDQAIQTRNTISAKTDDRSMYDQREKAQRDHDWALAGAREEGLEEGMERGRQEGREEGIERGKLIGMIQICEGMLGDPVTDDAQLLRVGLDELKSQLASLQQRLRDR